MKHFFTLLSTLLITSACMAQSGPYLFSGAGYQGNGQIGLLTEDAEAGIVLPALLASRSHGGWSVAAATRTGLKDLTEISGTAHLVLPWKDQVAVGIQHTGIDGYSEQRISFSYARRLFEKLNAAVQFDLNRNEAEEFDNVYNATWSVSFHAPLMKELSLSAWIYNPLGTESVLDLPSMARIGILYEPSEKIGVAVEAEKDWRHELRFKAGMNYHLHQKLTVRWGIGTRPSLVHAGITWNIFNNMALTGGWRYHSRLGSSLSASLSQYNPK
jgi:long-subunit fatty acid transport protein